MNIRILVITACLIAAMSSFRWLDRNAFDSFQVAGEPMEKYKEVRIGKQTWMNSNLTLTRFQNGDEILQVRTLQEWATANENKKPAWCYYEDSKKNFGRYGILYNGYAIQDQRGLAPKGWHIPTIEEWKELANFIDSNEGAALKLMSKDGWKNRKGSDAHGFNAKPTGLRSDGGSFGEKGISAYWWTSSRFAESNSYYYFSIESGYFDEGMHGRDYGFAIRCIKD